MTDKAETITLIRTEETRGVGSIDDRRRCVVTLWTMKGEKLLEMDPEQPLTEREQTLMDALRTALKGWQSHVPMGDITHTPEFDGDRQAIARLARLVE